MNFPTLVEFTTADVSLSKDVFDKAVKSALGRVNTHTTPVEGLA